MTWRLTTYFLWLSQKYASNLNLMTKWKIYLVWMQNCMRCFTLRVAFYIVHLRTPWGSFLSGTYRIELWVNYPSIIEQITSKAKWIRKFPILDMAAMFWRHVVIKSDNDPGLIKLKYRASRYLSMFCCDKPMCLYKLHWDTRIKLL